MLFRSRIKEIILSSDNRKDVEEIKDKYIKGLRFHYVGTIMEVVNTALLRQKVTNPRNIRFD